MQDIQEILKQLVIDKIKEGKQDKEVLGIFVNFLKKCFQTYRKTSNNDSV